MNSKPILAVLLGLVCIAFGDDSGEEFSWDSAEDSSTSYDGVVIQVYNPSDGEPVITLGTDQDNHESTYCLTLIRIFEATGYDLTQSTSTDDDYTEISGSSVDLSDANCIVSETSSTSFTIECNNVRRATLRFDFSFVTNSDGDEGLEYTITLEEYTFIGGEDAQLVLAQSMEECSDTYSYSADSGEVSEDDDSDDDDDADSTARGLLSSEEEDEEDVDDIDDTNDDDDDDDDDIDDEDTESDDDESTESVESSESAESDDGISSDDSDEFDTGFARFIADGQAYDQCEGEADAAIESQLIYNEDDKELHIVFNHFECTLFIDPYVGLDSSKIATSGACRIYVTVGALFGMLGALLFCYMM